jgi:hypothetical protein
MQARMSTKEIFYRRALVPACTIHVKPDRVTSQSAVKMCERLHKALPIASRHGNHAAPPQHGCHPPGKIEPRMMATRGRNPQPLAAFRPTSSQAGMQAEPRLVLKDHRLTPTQAPKFFLGCAETCELLRRWLADNCSWPASAGSPTDASSIGPVGPSDLFPIDASSRSPASARPTGRDLARRIGVTSPSPSPKLCSKQASTAMGALACEAASRRRRPERLHDESNGSSSSASVPGPGRSSPGADLRESGVAPQSLTLPRHPESAVPAPLVAPGWPKGGSTSIRDFACFKSVIRSLLQILMRSY